MCTNALITAFGRGTEWRSALEARGHRDIENVCAASPRFLPLRVGVDLKKHVSRHRQIQQGINKSNSEML